MHPDTLGPFDIDAVLGEGGMGTVYLARPRESVDGVSAGARVALKVMHAHMPEARSQRARLEREARIGLELHHHNVVRTLALLDVRDGAKHADVLVMEYVPGQTLRALLSEIGPLPEPLVRRIAIEVARGLQAIHEAGAVHRDLKPENVLIAPDHALKIMDLGVAHLADARVRLSTSGGFVGSIEYAAPEQFEGPEGGLDGRADLFALGTVLYELATGEHPFRAETPQGVMRRILRGDPPRVSSLRPQLSPFLDVVVETLLSRDRERRFRSAADLVAVLEAAEQGPWWLRRAHAIRVANARPLRRLQLPRETAFHGREAELAKLRRAYDAAAEGRGQAIFMTGETGVGKTRLVDELVAQLRSEGREFDFLFGAYPPGGASTLSGAFSTAFREHFGPDDLEAGVTRALAAAPLLAPAFAALLQGLPPPEDAVPLDGTSLPSAVVEVTRHLAETRPVVLLIDDLQFAPETGLALFAFLAQALSGHRVLLLGTGRPDAPGPALDNLEGFAHVTRLPLERLSEAEVGQVLEDALRSARLVEALRPEVARMSEGNPLFALAILRDLRERGHLSRAPDGRWVAKKPLSALEAPAGVLELVQARLHPLADRERELLEVAACAGVEFDPVLLAEVLGVDPVAALRDLGRVEHRYGLVHAEGPLFSFDHELIRRALYEGQPALLREAYHGAIADHLARHMGEPADDRERVVDLCEHALAGDRPDLVRAHLEAAVAHLTQGHVLDRATALLERALAVPDVVQGRARIQALVRLGECLHVQGRREAQRRAWMEAAELLEAHGTPQLEIQVESALGRLHHVLGEPEAARYRFQHVLEVARAQGDRAGEGVAHGGLALVHFSLGRFEEALTEAGLHRDLARELGDRASEASALGNSGIALYRLGRSAEARARFEEIRSIAEAEGNRSLYGKATANLAVLEADAGHFEKAHAYYDEALGVSKQVGDRRAHLNASVNLGNLLRSEGRLGDARDRLQQALVAAREIGDRVNETIVLDNLGMLAQAVGDHRASRAHFEHALELARALGACRDESYILANLAGLAEAEGDPAEAEALHERALALRQRIEYRPGLASSNLALGSLHAKRNDPERARVRFQEAEALARELELPHVRLLATVGLALLPGGDLREAETLLEELEPRVPPQTALRAHHQLWRHTGDERHLTEARRRLDLVLEGATPADREAMLKHDPVYREVHDA